MIVKDPHGYVSIILEYINVSSSPLTSVSHIQNTYRETTELRVHCQYMYHMDKIYTCISCFEIRTLHHAYL